VVDASRSEEELVAIARQLKADRRGNHATPLARTAVVFKRPLPYLYAAAEIFRAAGIPYQASDALPLAAEPTAAALDLLLEAVAVNFTRGSLVALLRSPHFVFRHGDVELTRESVSALDRRLSQARYLGDVERWKRWPMPPARLRCARRSRSRASLGRWHWHVRPRSSSAAARVLDRARAADPDDDRFASRERRARATIADTLTTLADAHAAHDDPPWTIDETGPAVRRRIEEQTFDPAGADAAGGLHLVDDQAVRYGEFDDVRSWAWSTPTGRSARGATFSIRRRC